MSDSELHKLLARAYWIGWKNCAGWADRDDLICDEGSSAYSAERDNDLAEMIGGLYAELSRLIDVDPGEGSEDGDRLNFLADLLVLHERKMIP